MGRDLSYSPFRAALLERSSTLAIDLAFC